jgi:hypothetical protein
LSNFRADYLLHGAMADAASAGRLRDAHAVSQQLADALLGTALLIAGIIGGNW